MNHIHADLVYRQGHIAIVLSRFNDFIGEQLLKGALDMLARLGVPADKIDVVKVPGAYELPLAAKKLASTGRYQGIIALGVVVRGATAHFDYVAGGCANGLGQVALEAEVPVAFGVLTTDTLEQAMERAGTKAGNKGADAAQCVLEMINLLTAIERGV